MTERQYSLPNCRLVLQGLNNDGDTSTRPLLSMITNVECYLAGQKTPISGGREFLDSLTASVSQYAQSYLSGIQNLVRPDRRAQTGLVQLQQVSSNLHRLTLQPQGQAATEVNLTTVQLFDLVEAVDQFFADAQTVPDLALKLDPLSKRYVAAAEPITKRAAPAAIGLSGLAAAAALLFMLPVPEVRRPEAESQGAQNATGAGTNETPPAGTSPDGSNAASSPDPNSPSSDSQSPVAANQSAGVDVTSAPEITDTDELDRLTVQLYDKLDLGWKKKPTFDGELVYRVGVNQDGDIKGYKYSNDAALTYLSDTPLADVQFDTPGSPSSPTSGDTSSNPSETNAETPSESTSDPLAQFRVVFKSDGVLEVSPWEGQSETESNTESIPEPDSPSTSP
jgi:hypothetical protein